MSDNDDLLYLWSSYVDELAVAVESCTRSEERHQYDRHLAAAAIIGSRLVARNRELAMQEIASERNAFGRGFLSAAAGESAERAFADFDRRISAAVAKS